VTFAGDGYDGADVMDDGADQDEDGDAIVAFDAAMTHLEPEGTCQCRE